MSPEDAPVNSNTSRDDCYVGHAHSIRPGARGIVDACPLLQGSAVAPLRRLLAHRACRRARCEPVCRHRVYRSSHVAAGETWQPTLDRRRELSIPFSVSTRWIQNPSSPASWMTTSGGNCFVRARTRSWSDRSRARRSPISPAGTECFDIFSRVPGDSEVTSHVVRLNSKETKIARRSVRIEVSVSLLSALLSMVSSNG